VAIPPVAGEVESTTDIPEVKGSVAQIPHVDRVRAGLAWFLVGLLGLIVLVGLFLVGFGSKLGVEFDALKSVLELFFTSMLTLVSSVLGFYFGTEHARSKEES
jgi:lipid-A-disaccharide synthase-like uncharacterized protein